MIFLRSYVIMPGGRLPETENKRICQISGLKSGRGRLRNHDVLKLRHELEEAEKDLTKKFNETTQYKNMKQMLTSKNDQIKELRSRLRKYEADA